MSSATKTLPPRNDSCLFTYVGEKIIVTLKLAKSIKTTSTNNHKRYITENLWVHNFILRNHLLLGSSNSNLLVSTASYAILNHLHPRTYGTASRTNRLKHASIDIESIIYTTDMWRKKGMQRHHLSPWQFQGPSMDLCLIEGNLFRSCKCHRGTRAIHLWSHKKKKISMSTSKKLGS